MNINCETQKVGFCEALFESTAEQSLDADISLPDYCPEIQRVLKCTVTPNVNSVQNNSGRVTADVTAVVRVIYVGENGKAAAYEQSYPLQKFIESNRITSDSAVSVTVNTDYVNCRAVNPRRIDVRGILTFFFKAFGKREEHILCGAHGAGTQLLTDDCSFASMTGVCERAFSLSEVVELDETREPISQIINASSSVTAGEVRIINNKALVKGECTVKIFYLSENGSIESLEHAMPISQIIELDGINEKSISSLRLTASSCEASAKSNSSGDMRLVDLNMRISAFMAAFEEIPLSLITDAYSTEYELKNTVKNTEAFEYNDSFNSVFTNKVVFESIGVSVDCVLAVWCSEMKHGFSIKDGQCVASGTYNATVIYRDSENQIGVIQKPVDFEYTSRLPYKAERITCYGSVSVLGCSCAVTGDSRLELKTEMAVNATVFSSKMKKYISSVEISGEQTKNEKPCALTIYFCNSGESLWNIAKRYSTTVDAIMLENSIENDVVESGRMLMIPCV